MIRLGSAKFRTLPTRTPWRLPGWHGRHIERRACHPVFTPLIPSKTCRSLNAAEGRIFLQRPQRFLAGHFAKSKTVALFWIPMTFFLYQIFFWDFLRFICDFKQTVIDHKVLGQDSWSESSGHLKGSEWQNVWLGWSQKTSFHSQLCVIFLGVSLGITEIRHDYWSFIFPPWFLLSD